MSLTLRLRFPHRRYHATSWEQAANSGQVEWPPSPWRLTRSLLSVALTRHPELDQDTVLDACRHLTTPPVYFVPPTRHGHTRHYMPKSTQRSGENDTELTLDSYVSIDPADALFLTWDSADLASEDEEILTALVTSLPYLGRAESLVEAELVAEPPREETWAGTVWRPHPAGMQRLLRPRPDITPEQWHITTHQMRKSRRLLPEGAEWVSYEEIVPLSDVTRPRLVPQRVANRVGDLVTVMRWAFASPAPYEAVNAIQATARLRGLALSVTKTTSERADRSPEDADAPGPVNERDAGLLSGHPSDLTQRHGHAHWLWLEDSGRLTDLVMWVPAGISTDTAERISSVVGWSGLRMREGDRLPPGFVPGDMNLIGWGSATDVATLFGDADRTADGTVWRSATPHLIGRLGKRNQSLESLALENVERELAYRFDDPPAVRSLQLVDGPAHGRPTSANRYRQRSWSQHPRRGERNVPAVWLRVEFEAPLTPTPLVLGKQSHFGFGRMVPWSR